MDVSSWSALLASLLQDTPLQPGSVPARDYNAAYALWDAQRRHVDALTADALTGADEEELEQARADLNAVAFELKQKVRETFVWTPAFLCALEPRVWRELCHFLPLDDMMALVERLLDSGALDDAARVSSLLQHGNVALATEYRVANSSLHAQHSAWTACTTLLYACMQVPAAHFDAGWCQALLDAGWYMHAHEVAAVAAVYPGRHAWLAHMATHAARNGSVTSDSVTALVRLGAHFDAPHGIQRALVHVLWDVRSTAADVDALCARSECLLAGVADAVNEAILWRLRYPRILSEYDVPKLAPQWRVWMAYTPSFHDAFLANVQRTLPYLMYPPVQLLLGLGVPVPSRLWLRWVPTRHGRLLCDAARTCTWTRRMAAVAAWRALQRSLDVKCATSSSSVS